MPLARREMGLTWRSSKEMNRKKIIRKINAGEKGTKRLVKKYGGKLVCVRYIYDPENKKRTKTVELLEHIDDWHPDSTKIPWNKMIHLKVEYGETHVGKLIRSAGGKWNKAKKYWELPYREVISLGLEDRIING